MSDVPPQYPQQQPYPQQPYPQQPYPQQPAPGFANAPGGYGGPPPDARGVVDKKDIRPKARWFWIGGGIMILGVAAAILFGVLGVIGISGKVDDFERVSEGSDTIRIESTGEYVIYTEDGSFFPSVELISPDGEPVNTRPYLTGLTYGFGGRSGQAVATFEATDTGRYTINTTADVAIGDSIGDDLVRTIVIPFVIAGLGLLIGLIVIIVTAVKRSGSKKRLAYGG